VEKRDNIIACYMSVNVQNFDESGPSDPSAMVRRYIWGEHGIDPIMKRLKHEHYGTDLQLVLFEFYVKPYPFQIERLGQIGRYRKKESSIGIPIIINDENFLSKSEEERQSYLRQSVLQKLDLLAEVVKRRKLDTNIELLRADLQKILG
jgi:hypothetical protein